MNDEKGIESSERNSYVILAQDYKGCPDGKFHVNCGNLVIFQSNLKFQLMGIFMFHHEQPKIEPTMSCSAKKHLGCWAMVAAVGSNKLLNVSKGITGPWCVSWCCSLDYHRFLAAEGAQTEHHADAQGSL